MPWQITLVIYLLAVAALALARRVHSKQTKIPQTVTPAIYNVLVVLPAGIIASLIIGDFDINWSWSVALRLASMGSLISVFSWLSLRAFEQLSVAVYQTIFQLFSLTAVVGGWIFLGESLTSMQIVGGVMLIAGAVLAAQSTKEDPHVTLKGAVFAAVGSIALGSAVVFEKSLLEDISIGAYFVVGWAAQALSSTLLAVPELRTYKLSSIRKKDLLSALRIGFIILFVGFSFIYTISESDNVGLIALISAFALPLSALGSYVFLHERNLNRTLMAGLVVGFVGLLITAL